MTIDKSEKIKHLPTQKRRVLLSLEGNGCQIYQILKLLDNILEQQVFIAPYIFIPRGGRIPLLCISFSTLSYSEKLLTTFCISNLPLVWSSSVRKGWDNTDNVSAACCLSVSV